MKLFSHGILGMNARNLKYIRAKNSAESISLADSKLKTKRFLESRGIPFAETYAILGTHQELKDFSLKSIKTEDFVIKPNKGSRGRGILIIKRIGETFIINNEEWTEDEVKLHMTDIIHGSFSLHGSSDTVIIEELLGPGIDFAHFCKYGLADIRIIVYNYVPITAMIRMPTIKSESKANLSQGGIGLGLNIANGQIISLYQNKEIFTHIFPLEHDGLKDRIIPYWDDILLFSSQVQMYTKLGYLALDWVITKNGPKLLEINARAGLEIQNVNLVPLAFRLNKIEDLKILTPEKGVEIAKTLFHTETLSTLMGKKTLYLEQKGMVGDKEIIVTVDMSNNNSFVSQDIIDSVGNSDIHILTDSNISMLLKKFNISSIHNNTIMLGMNDIQNYLINPSSHIIKEVDKSNPKWIKEILNFDKYVYRVGKKLNLSSLLKPDNYFFLLDRFIQNPIGFNPVFEYHFPSKERIDSIRNTLGELINTANNLKQSGHIIADLYLEKLSENQSKLGLIEAYKNEDYEKIQLYNSLLFGDINDELLEVSKKKVFEIKRFNDNSDKYLGKILSLDEIVLLINKYFETHNIKKIPINIVSGNLSRMSISYGKEVKIHISNNALIREKEINSILSHEIDTHFRRYLSGLDTGLLLFQFGTGYYLSDEEGLAIYRSFNNLPEGYKKNAMYMKYYLLSIVDTLSFASTVEVLISLYPGKKLESIFSDAVRLKRGISHSGVEGIPGTTYRKDKIYLDGYNRISKWIESGGDPERLLFGKIKISDLKIFEQL
ncbi:MAG: DUF1704 domain-containing protein [Candidatus Gracilibacteria bacterium]|nr:DUF1704 domain-containing protein [Candidatus Gracilibacteria bacterium]MDD2908974.1 DUF1704 domain-containing protein [Candidatus Gracilibacteria bacterium]